MATSIEWTDKVWNPTTGCKHYSAWGECDNCYAEVLTNRWQNNPKQVKYKEGFGKLVMHESSLNEPYEWKKPLTIFVNSMSDLFHKDVSLEFLQKVFKVMNDTPQHTYQILTKRDALLEEYSDQLEWTDNIWMGVSVRAQGATRRIPRLVNCGAKHKFLSVEPFIDEINNIDLTGIDWVIVGGESGNGARPVKKEWVFKMKEFCDKASVPLFFKQWGDKKYNPDPNDPTINKHHRYHAKGGSQLDGKNYLANPTIKDDSIPTINLFGDDYCVMDEVGELKELKTIWELKSYLPMADKVQLKNLKEDIKVNGVLDPILYWVTPNGDKLVIEGHTRIIASGKKKIPSKEVKGDFKSLDDIRFWMLTHQLNRRNLDEVEKLRLAYSYKSQIEARAKANLSKGGKGKKVDEPVDTAQAIANLANVSKSTVTRYGRVMTNGNEKIIKQLHSNKLSVYAASKAVGEEVPERKPVKHYETDFEVFKSITEAKKALKNSTINAIIVVPKDVEAKTFVKTNTRHKIGVVEDSK